MLWYLFGSKNKNDWFDQTYFGVINFIVLFVLLELLFYFFGVISYCDSDFICDLYSY